MENMASVGNSGWMFPIMIMSMIMIDNKKLMAARRRVFVVSFPRVEHHSQHLQDFIEQYIPQSDLLN